MYTIKEAAKKVSVSEHTLRFWAKSGFFPFLTRDENNIRRFSENDMQWIRIVNAYALFERKIKILKGILIYV